MTSNSYPLIGIPTYRETKPTEQRPRYWLYETYVQALRAAGAIPVLLPLLEDPYAANVLDRLDGVLLAGGDDVNPTRYDQTPHPKTEVPDDKRDQLEIELAQLAVDAHKPLLAVCRGIQVLNVAFGGTLIQHIPELVPNAIKHEYDYDDYHERHNVTHQVDVVQGTRLASIMGSGQVGVNSFHHQAVDRLAEGFRPVACAPDGVIEAMERVNGKRDDFVLAVQWHPEDMFHKNEQMLRLFQAFVERVRENR